MAYIALNVHTGYDFLSSALKCEDLSRICERFDFSYLGICDCGMFGYPSFYKALKKGNRTPLYGLSLTVTDEINEFPLVVYIKNDLGYRNLCNLIYDYPDLKVPLKSLANYQTDLIAILESQGNGFLKTSFQKIDEYFSKLLFDIQKGFDDFYIGLEIYQNSDLFIADKIRTFANSHNYNIVFFNRHLYEKSEDAITYSILQAIKKEEKLTRQSENGPFYFREEKILRTIFRDDELENTLKIAKLIEFELIKKRGKLLNFPLKANDKRQHIFERASCNIKNIYGSIESKYVDRLNYELDIIEKMGYLDYFLIVSDYVTYAKNHDIPVGPGRGSAAGSLISFALNITTVDPLKYNLQFERFLNPMRISMPDIDIDFSDRERQEVVDYIADFYGEDRMANIVTYQTIGAKQSLRDIGKVFSFNQYDINELCSKIRLYNDTLRNNYKANVELRELLKDKYFLKIVTLASKIEGFPRQRGMHAAGIILNEESLKDVIPVVRESNHHLISQFDMTILESLGFLKMDLLGLRNLTLIQDIVKRIQEKDETFSLNAIPLDDSKTFDLFRRDMVLGIFQLESSGMRQAMKEIVLNNFDDLVALLALYRPGPMESIPIYAERKNKNLPLTYLDSRLEPILNSTYGVIIYQEQITEIVKTFAGFDLGKADLFRRAISKKDASQMESLKKDFIDGTIANGIDKKVAYEIFDLIDRFANYGFNKSHSVCYALISYQLQYLKANHPREFFASYLDQETLDDRRYAIIKNEFNYFGLSLELPDINRSTKRYEIDQNKLLIPLTSIKGISSSVTDVLITLRKNSLFDNLSDLISRLINTQVGETHVISLINAGALDSFKETRTTLRSQSPLLFEYYNSFGNMITLLSEEEKQLTAPRLKRFVEDTLIKNEQEYQVLGILISGSFLERYQSSLNKKNIKPIINQLSSYELNIACVVIDVRTIITKKKTMMAVLVVNDDSYSLEVVIFSSLYAKVAHYLKRNNALFISGHIRKEKDKVQLLADDIKLLEDIV